MKEKKFKIPDNKIFIEAYKKDNQVIIIFEDKKQKIGFNYSNKNK
jgi:hypothetical protein